MIIQHCSCPTRSLSRTRCGEICTKLDEEEEDESDEDESSPAEVRESLETMVTSFRGSSTREQPVTDGPSAYLRNCTLYATFWKLHETFNFEGK